MTSPIDLARTHPAALHRLRERVSITTEAARRAGGYLAGLPYRGIAPSPAAVAALDAFRRPLQDAPRPAREVLRELDEIGSPATVAQSVGRYFGYVNGGVEPAAAGAAILASAWDQNVGLPGMSPAASVLDEVAAGWVVDLLGLPSDAVATFTAGASLANLTGIIAGRDALLARLGWSLAEQGLTGAPALRVIVGEEVHASALKALRLAGFGTAQLERVPVDDVGAMRADALPPLDERCLVLLQAGNVTTGASDPFAAILRAAKAAGAWVHVDGAFGLWAAASPTRAHLVAGVELADSWATDAHKWLNAPYDSGIVIVRERADLHRAMGIGAAYLAHDATRPLMELSAQMSQRARGVETWALLAARGREGIASLVDDACERATQLAGLLADAGVQVLAEPVLNQVPVAFGDAPGAEPDDRITAAVIAAIQAEGTIWAGSSVWRGRTILRLSVSDAATTSDDIVAAADAIVRCWEAVRA